MRIIPHSFNGFLFQQNTKVASTWNVPYDWTIAGISTNGIQRSRNFPVYAAKDYTGSIKVIQVAFNDVDMHRDSLVIAMDVLGEDQHKLFALDEFGNVWYVNAICIGINEEGVDGDTAVFGAVFDVDDPIWKKYVQSSETITVTTTDTLTLNLLGNQPALPTITITPTAGTSGFTYRRFVTIINNSLNPLTNYPLNLTGAGMDTAAMVTAGKMLSSGNDLRIFIDGVEVKRWFQDFDTANTLVWINWTQPGNSNMTLGANILITGDVPTITIQNTAAKTAKIPLIPTSGNIKIGNEIYVYTGVDIKARQLTGCTRAERETSASAHSIGDVIYFVTHDVWFCYGNPSIEAYVVDDTTRPIIELNSSNTSHIYADFGSNVNARSGAWVPTGYRQGAGGGNGLYTGYQNGLETDPWEVMGANGLSNWKLYNPCGITDITECNREKIYRWSIKMEYQF